MPDSHTNFQPLGPQPHLNPLPCITSPHSSQPPLPKLACLLRVVKQMHHFHNLNQLRKCGGKGTDRFKSKEGSDSSIFKSGVYRKNHPGKKTVSFLGFGDMIGYCNPFHAFAKTHHTCTLQTDANSWSGLHSAAGWPASAHSVLFIQTFRSVAGQILVAGSKWQFWYEIFILNWPLCLHV